ncbi:uncharacterized protein DAT39_023068, partial [Clarias magur]
MDHLLLRHLMGFGCHTDGYHNTTVIARHYGIFHLHPEEKDTQHDPEALVSECEISIPREYKTAYCTQSYKPDADKNLLRSSASISPNHKWNIQMHTNASAKVKEHLKPGDSIPRESEETSDHWAKKRKMFKESRQWGSAEESSMTSNITDESVRERTVKISKGMGEYPWGFRIQYSKPIIVTEVDTNGAAEEAGLKVGDYVLAVNGTDVTAVPHSEAVDLARQGPDLLILTIGSDIGRTPNTPKPACRGYLHKRTQSSFLKGWRKRWFVLRHDCCLYYYRNKRDEGNSHALAVMRMEGAVVEADTSLGKPFVFKCSPVAGNRVYYFCATSNQEMR